jgi:hypothetical protein
MKRTALLILVFSLIFVMRGIAQEHMFEFVTAGGEIVPNGSIVTVTEFTEDEYGDVEMSSGIYAKRVDADADQLVRIAYNVGKMDNGSMQICYPFSCATITQTGAGATQPGGQTNEQESIQTEWFPSDYGTCRATLTLDPVVKTKLGHESLEDGPSITLVFSYADPSRVSATSTKVATPVAYYNLSGRPVAADTKGVVLVRMSDGRVVKRIRKG